MTKHELIMDIAKQSDPSFKAFLTSVMLSYEKFRETHKTSWKNWPLKRVTKHLRRLIVEDIGNSLEEIVVYCYVRKRLVEIAAGSGDSAEVKSR